MANVNTSNRINGFEKFTFSTLIRYDCFGFSTNVKHDPTNKKQFTGKETDEDSGLQYFIARYYDPEVGRFSSKDPVPNDNLYVYCDSNPINKIDPDGRDALDDKLKLTEKATWYGKTDPLTGKQEWSEYLSKIAYQEVKNAVLIHENVHKKQFENR